MNRHSHVETPDPAGARRCVRGLATALALGLTLVGLGVSTAGADFDYSTSGTLSLNPMHQGSCPSTSLCLVPDTLGRIWTSTNATGGAAATWASNQADVLNGAIDGGS